MSQRIVTWLLFYSILLTIAGCYSTHYVSQNEIGDGKHIRQDSPYRDENVDILSVVAFNDSTRQMVKYEFAKFREHYGVMRDSTITGLCVDGTMVSIPLSKVEHVNVQKYDSGKTGLYMLAFAVPVAVIILYLSISTGINQMHGL